MRPTWVLTVAFAEKAGGRDLAVGTDAGEQCEDPELAFGELLEAARRCRVGWGAMHEVFDEAAGERGGEEGVPAATVRMPAMSRTLTSAWLDPAMTHWTTVCCMAQSAAAARVETPIFP
jgi:hypothetical protein